MDIARLLSRDDTAVDSASEDNGVASIVIDNCILRPVTTVARRRRQPVLQSLRARAEAYEYAVKILPVVLHESSSRDDEPTDVNSRRMRAFLNQSLVMIEETKHELRQRAELLQMLKHFQNGTSNVQKLFRGVQLDDWHWQCERWRALALEHYEPLTKAQCDDIIEHTLYEIRKYRLRGGTKAKHGSLFGWRDSLTIDGDPRYVHFVTHKTYFGAEIKQTADQTWSIYGDSHQYQLCTGGPSVDVFHQVVQYITPDILIFQAIERYTSVPKMVFALSIAFRMPTETGYVLAVRPIQSPRLRSVLTCEGLSMGDSFFWCTHTVTARDAHGVCCEFESRLTGCMGADEPGYARRWITEFMLAVVRSDSMATGKPFAQVESAS